MWFKINEIRTKKKIYVTVTMCVFNIFLCVSPQIKAWFCTLDE